MTRLAAVLLLACSCSEPLPIRMSDRRDALPPEVLDACEFWGIACELSDRLYGSVKVGLIEVQHGQRVLGENWGAGGCRPGLWADPSSRNRVAHELGHILVGPEHSDDPDNVMWHGGADDGAPSDEQLEAGERNVDEAEATDEQLDAAERGADRLVRCR